MTNNHHPINVYVIERLVVCNCGALMRLGEYGHLTANGAAVDRSEIERRWVKALKRGHQDED